MLQKNVQIYCHRGFELILHETFENDFSISILIKEIIQIILEYYILNIMYLNFL